MATHALLTISINILYLISMSVPLINITWIAVPMFNIIKFQCVLTKNNNIRLCQPKGKFYKPSSHNFADLQSATLKYVLRDPRRIVPPM